MLDDLPERERVILLHRYYGNKTQSEIAGLMGLSQMHVSRRIKRTLNTLRHILLKDGLRRHEGGGPRGGAAG